MDSAFEFIDSDGTYNDSECKVTWIVGNLNCCGSASLWVVVKASASGTFENTATVSSNETSDISNKTAVAVEKIKPPVAVDAPEITVGEDGVITVTVPEDATGTITVEIEGKTYTQEIKDGKAVFTVPGLEEGIHAFKAYYSGDNKYLPADTIGSIKVDSTNKTDEPDKPALHVVLAKRETGNPLYMIYIILLVMGTAQFRRFNE